MDLNGDGVVEKGEMEVFIKKYKRNRSWIIRNFDTICAESRRKRSESVKKFEERASMNSLMFQNIFDVLDENNATITKAIYNLVLEDRLTNYTVENVSSAEASDIEQMVSLFSPITSKQQLFSHFLTHKASITQPFL